jgi:hypothetical protein
MRTAIILTVLVCLLITPSMLEAGGALMGFTALELLPIENERNQKGQKLPDEFVPDLHEQILYNVVGKHVFQRVNDHVDSAVKASVPDKVVQMKVRITGYSGAQNRARVSSELSFIDKESGTVVLKRDIKAQLQYDQGALTAAMRKLSRSIADAVVDAR